MTIIFLDDAKFRQQTFRYHVPSTIIVQTAQECIAMLKQQGGADLLFLDHDLGDTQFADPSGENTGSEVVRWIVANKPKIGQIFVHSFNTSATPVMVSDLTQAGYTVEASPFSNEMARKVGEWIEANKQ